MSEQDRYLEAQWREGAVVELHQLRAENERLLKVVEAGKVLRKALGVMVRMLLTAVDAQLLPVEACLVILNEWYRELGRLDIHEGFGERFDDALAALEVEP